ncbi:TetR/AcrR family transcriptional regulator [Priestia flexa]|uniref:TetR/AcrR family transcriptional regulator n=1 Tax=Priestia flexa TaxID=86664 RepID=UPI003D2ECD31
MSYDELKSLIKKPDKIFTDENLTNKQRDILHAALELFADRGFNGTTTQTIAKKAKVSEKTLFKYYSTKQELFNQTIYPAMLQILRPALVSRTDKVIQEQKEKNDLRSILQSLFHDRIDFARDNTDIVKLTMQELLLSSEFRYSLTEFFQQEAMPRIEKVLQNEQKYKDIPTDSFIRVILSLLTGYMLTKTILLPDKEYDDEKEVQLMMDILFNGLASYEIKKN